MSSSVVSLKRGVHVFMLLFLVCLLASPGMADTVDTPVRQYGYSYGFTMSGITALSPDGTQFVVASGARAHIVDTNTGLPQRTLSGHLQAINAVAWSADGRRIATGSDDLTARVWDAATGGHICTTSQPRGEVLSVALSADGSRLITGTASLWVGDVVVLPGSAYVWDGNTGVGQGVLSHGADVYSVAISADGTRAATGTYLMLPDDERVYGAAYLWNLSSFSGSLIVVTGESYTQWGTVSTVAFGSGNRVITGGGGGDVDSAYWEARVWTYTNANPPVFTLDRRLRPLLNSTARVASLSVSGSGVLAAGLSNGNVRRWKISDGADLPTFSAHGGEIKSVSHSSDSATTFVGSADGFVSQWDTSTGRLLRSGHRSAVNAAMFSPDGARILTGSSDDRAFLWETGSSIEALRMGSAFGHWNDVKAAVYSADGSRILTGSSDTTGKLWDSANGTDLRTFMWHGQPVNAVAFSPDGLTVATGSSDLQAKLWDAGTGVLLQTFTGHSAEVTAVAFSPDGLTVATGSTDATAKLWDVATGALVKTLSGHTGPVSSVAFSPDGTRVLTGARSAGDFVDNTARLWDTGTGSVVHIFVGHARGVTAVAFSPDGFQVLTGSRDGTALLWDVQSGVELRRYTGHVGEVTSVAFSPTERRIVTGSTDRVARLWEGLVVVPNVVGQVQATAQSILTAASLYAGPITQAYNDTIPAGSVASQNPAGGTGVSAWSSVALVISLGPEPVLVPNVVGQPQSAAQAALVAVRLVVGTVTQQYSATVPAGVVISQAPVAGTAVLPTSAVDLVVSLGPAPVLVPNVIGQAQAAASAVITGAGFAVGTVTQQYDPAPAGTVISQSPLGGTMAVPDTPVNLVVSRGPQPVVIVPNIVGLSPGSAAAALLTADLIVGVLTEQHSATVPAGLVISQNPPAGAQVLAGTPVDAAISLGPQPIPVPNVVGLPQAAAEAAILGAGLAVGTVTEETSETVPAGSVASQDPAAGVEVLPGTPVNIVVSLGPPPVEVPDVVGKPQATANNLITDAGLVVGTVTEEYSTTVLAGRVMSQSPEAGEEVPPGTLVDLVVSRGPAPVTVPSLVGSTRSAAVDLLTAAQLKEGSVTYEYSDTVAREIVLSQAKTPGSEVPAGSGIDFVVSRGAAPGIVPDIVGELRSNAEADITAAGLVVGTVTEQYSETVRKDRVIRQSPSAGVEISKGSAVNFTVSLGKEPAETSAVPNVVNTPISSARAAITAAGFAVGVETPKYDATVPAGWVMAQSPAGGTQSAPGTPVDLVVSLGKYLGPNADEARVLLAGLFEEADTDGDGKLSWEEALAALPSLSRAVFDELDTNTDGYLDRDELGLGGCGACGCQKGDMTPGGLKKRLGDLFLSALALSVLAVVGRRGR